MFKCRYSLNGECQLFSWPCKKLECNVFRECSSCEYRHLSPGDEPCVRCDAKENDYVIQQDI